MQAQLDAQAVWYWRQGHQGGVTCPPTGITLMGQAGLSATALPFMPGGLEAVDLHAALFNSKPRASDQMQPMGPDFRSMVRSAPVNVYMSFQQEKFQLQPSYGDHQIADPMSRIGPKEWTNLPEQSVLDPDMQQMVKVMRKVEIEQIDSSKLQWSHWRQMFKLQMMANAIPKCYWVKLAGMYFDD